MEDKEAAAATASVQSEFNPGIRVIVTTLSIIVESSGIRKFSSWNFL